MAVDDDMAKRVEYAERQAATLAVQNELLTNKIEVAESLLRNKKTVLEEAMRALHKKTVAQPFYSPVEMRALFDDINHVVRLAMITIGSPLE